MLSDDGRDSSNGVDSPDDGPAVSSGSIELSLSRDPSEDSFTLADSSTDMSSLVSAGISADTSSGHSTEAGGGDASVVGVTVG